jgi:hypothetical protein
VPVEGSRKKANRVKFGRKIEGNSSNGELIIFTKYK